MKILFAAASEACNLRETQKHKLYIKIVQKKKDTVRDEKNMSVKVQELVRSASIGKEEIMVVWVGSRT